MPIIELSLSLKFLAAALAQPWCIHAVLTDLRDRPKFVEKSRW
jgi:hypothetical protein